MATTVDYILKVNSEQGQASLVDLAKRSFEVNKGLIKVAAAAAGAFVAFKTMASGIKIVTVAFIDSSKAIIEFSQKSADLINNINDLGTRSGVSAANIKGLQFAFQASGQSISEATSFLSRFPSVLAQSEEATSKTAEAFERLGVAVRDDNGNFRDSNKIFTETVSALTDMEAGTERNVLASQLFGRSSSKLMQALGDKSLKDFVALTDQFGVSTGPKASQAAAKFQQAIAALSTATDRLKSQFIEVFGDDIVELLIEFVVHLNLAGNIINEFSDTITRMGTIFLTVMKGLALIALDIGTNLGKSFIGGIPIIGKFITPLLELGDQLNVVDKAIISIAENLPNMNNGFGAALKSSQAFEKSLRSMISGQKSGVAGGGGGGSGSGIASGAQAGAQAGFEIVGLTIVDGISASMTNVMANSQAENEAFFKSLRLENIASMLGKLEGGIQLLSSPRGMVTGIAAAFGPIGSAIGGIVNALGALGTKTPEEIQQEAEAFSMAVANGLAMLPRILIQVLPKFVLQLIKGIGLEILKLPFIIADAIFESLKKIFQPIIDFFSASKEERQENRQSRRDARKRRREKDGNFVQQLFNTDSGFLSGGIMSAASGARFTGGSRGLAMLHEGETVLPASGRAGQQEQRMLSQAGGGGGINIVINSAVVEHRAIDELVRQLESRFGTFGVGKTPLFGR